VIRFVEIPLGRGSVCPCVRCSAPAEREFYPAEAISARVGDAVAAWRDDPGPNILFTGPEPFSHPELPAIVTSAAAANAEGIALRTDAGALAIPGNAEGVLAAGVTQLQVVLLAGTAAEHDALTSRTGLFDAATSGVASFLAAARASRAQVAVTGLVPVCAHNLASLPATVASLARAGAVAVEIAASPTAAASPGFSEWTAAAIDTGLVNGVWVGVTGTDRSTSTHDGLTTLTPFTVSLDAS